MSKSAVNDITTRKLTMILHARNHVDAPIDKSSTRPQRDALPHEDALHAVSPVNQALVDLLVTKGIISREELLERIQEIRKAR
jgi:hypothetical protein